MNDQQNGNELATKKSFIDVGWKRLIDLQKIILILFNIFSILGIGISVLFRYVLKINLVGYEEVIMTLVIWLYFIGSVHGSYERSHITVDLISEYVKSEKVKQAFQLFISIITAAFCLLFTYWGLEFFLWSLESGGKLTSTGIPKVIPQSAVFFGFLLMSLHAIIQL